MKTSEKSVKLFPAEEAIHGRLQANVEALDDALHVLSLWVLLYRMLTALALALT